MVSNPCYERTKYNLYCQAIIDSSKAEIAWEPIGIFFCLQHKASFLQVVLAFSKSQPTAELRVDGLGSTDKGLGFGV